MIEPETAAVLHAVPEFTDRFLAMVEAADGDPGGAATFSELADFAGELTEEMVRCRPVLERLMDGVESVAASSPDARELVGWCFLDSLSPDELLALRPFMGERTGALLDSLDEDSLDDLDDLDDPDELDDPDDAQRDPAA